MKFSIAILASLLSSADAFTTHPASLRSTSSTSPYTFSSSALHLSEYNMGYSRRGEDVNAMSMQQLKSIVNRMGFDERGHDRAALVMIAKGYPEAVRAVPLNGYRDRHEMYDRGYERFGSDYNSRGVGMDYRGNMRYQDRSAPTRMYDYPPERYYDDRRPTEFYDDYDDDDDDFYFENDYRRGNNGPPVQRRERMERRDMGPSRDLASNRGPMEQNVVGRRAPPPPPPPMDDRMDDRQREPPMERKEPSMNTMPGMDPKERELFERELARQKRGQRTGPANFGGDAPGFNPVPGSSGRTNAPPPSTSPTTSNTNSSSSTERRNENPQKDLEKMTYGELQQAVQKMGFDPKNHDQAALQMILKGYPEAVNARPLNRSGDSREDDFYLRDDRYLDEEEEYYAARGSPRSSRSGRSERGGPGVERRPFDPRSRSTGDMRGNGRGDMRGDSRGMRGRSNTDRRGGREYYDERDPRERRPNGYDNYGPRPRGGGDRRYDERFYNGGYDDFRRGGDPRGAPPGGYYGDNRRGGY